MKQKIEENIEIPSGVSCEVADRMIVCKKGSSSLSRTIDNSEVEVTISGNQIMISCNKGNKNHLKFIKSLAAHLRNLFTGLDQEYIYNLEACNVHFPMTLKIDGSRLVINNFLGEKTPRYAEIVPGSTVDIKGLKITVKSASKDAAGQTAANIEKATKVKNRDRRVFQDGIYITEKPGRGI